MKNSTLSGRRLIMPFLFILLCSFVTFGQHRKEKVSQVIITFHVDMTYQFEKGAFNPLTDTLDIPGTMNNWTGSPRMTVIPATHIYQYAYTVDSGTILQYKYRINGNWATSEFPNGGPNRMYLVPGIADTVSSFYDDYQPGTVPVTFKCHMTYQIRTERFDKANDFLDIAGSMNNWGAYDILFDRANDSIYTIKMNVDTLYVFNVTPLEFKFRINGNWETSEFPDGGPNRIFRVEDTTGGFQNIVDVWYNDEDPTIPAPPMAYNVKIQGNLAVGETLTGTYSYEDVNGDPEGNSKYLWYRADSVTQPEPELIADAHTINYLLTEADVHKYIAFAVGPVSATGNPPDGAIVIKWSDAFVAGVGINEENKHIVHCYPNPVSRMLYFNNPGTVEKAEIFSMVGKSLLSVPLQSAGRIMINTAFLEPGIYFIRFTFKEGDIMTSKFIRK